MTILYFGESSNIFYMLCFIHTPQYKAARCWDPKIAQRISGRLPQRSNGHGADEIHVRTNVQRQVCRQVHRASISRLWFRWLKYWTKIIIPNHFPDKNGYVDFYEYSGAHWNLLTTTSCKFQNLEKLFKISVSFGWKLHWLVLVE